MTPPAGSPVPADLQVLRERAEAQAIGAAHSGGDGFNLEALSAVEEVDRRYYTLALSSCCLCCSSLPWQRASSTASAPRAVAAAGLRLSLGFANCLAFGLPAVLAGDFAGDLAAFPFGDFTLIAPYILNLASV